ncbi:MAG: hypothetical protein EA356_06405 [Geminicoccaceae bacterium]|nr:MAG: hypothetical protein EA356_06405 [Geminicoccaceae bacterium]
MGAASTLANIGLNAAMSRSRAKSQSAAIATDRDLRVAEVQASDAADRKLREQRLKELLARQRALAASAGAAGAGGSPAAVRRGLQGKASFDDAIAAQQREMAIHGIRTRAASQKRRNLLESDNRLIQQGVSGMLGAGRSLLDL